MKLLRSVCSTIFHIVLSVICFKSNERQGRGTTTLHAMADSHPCYCKLESLSDANKDFNIETSQVTQPLLPGLLNDLAIACLIRVPRIEHRKLRIVCKSWCNLLSNKSFYLKRETLGLAEEWVYVVKTDSIGNISCNAFDPIYRLWQPLPPVPRGHVGAFGLCCTVLSGCHLYLFGGRDPINGIMRGMIFYCVKTNKWHKASNMLHKRHFGVSCVINNFLYVTGGENERLPIIHSPAEVYDPKEDIWTFVSRMNTRMAPLMGVVFNGKWFVKGLWSLAHDFLCEVFIPETNTWAQITNGLISGVGTSSIAINGRIFTLDERMIKEYDSITDSWNILIDVEDHMEIYGIATLIPLHQRLCIVDENSINLLDVPSLCECASTSNNGFQGSILGSGNLEISVTNLWSNPQPQPNILGSHVQYCQVLKI